MDYNELAREFIQNMRTVQTLSWQKRIRDDFRGEFFILQCIRERQGKTDPSHIRDTIGVSSARVATILNSLESKGLITREIDVDDRRKIIVTLTQKGADQVEVWRKEQTERIKDFLMLLGEEDAKELVRILGRSAEVLSAPRV
ncbi:MAG: MarR family transcriptional regulator [Candidatus Methanoplasma sp.]|jgi:DNA-binding MarR family transcriptional regulator|nr:MarR family transcriptional regulator [Candidatus Methanoplasma sp.]